MPLQFLDDEVKGRLAEVLRHDDREAIARATGIAYTLVKEQFNSESMRTSVAFQVLRIACAISDIDEERGDEYMDRLRDMYEQSKPRRLEPVDVNAELGRLIEMATSLSTGRLAGKPEIDLLIELKRVERQMRLVQHGLMNEVRTAPVGRLTPDGLTENGKRKVENGRNGNGILPEHVRESAKRYRR